MLALGTDSALGAAALTADGSASARVASEDPGDEWGDEWGDDSEEPGDDWDDDGCVVTDENGEPIADDSCWEDDDPCLADEGAAAQPVDDDWGDDWGDEDPGEEAGESTCDEDPATSEHVAPPLISDLHASDARGSRVRVDFRLDRAGHIILTLKRTGQPGKANRRCAKPARAAKRRAAGKPSNACGSRVAVRGALSIAGRSGANATTLRRWNGQPLAPGAYRLTATPDAAGGRGASTTFTLRPPARPR